MPRCLEEQCRAAVLGWLWALGMLLCRAWPEEAWSPGSAPPSALGLSHRNCPSWAVWGSAGLVVLQGGDCYTSAWYNVLCKCVT